MVKEINAEDLTLSKGDKLSSQELREKCLKKNKRKLEKFHNDKEIFKINDRLELILGKHEGGLRDLKTYKFFTLYQTGRLENPIGELMGCYHSPDLIRSLISLIEDILIHGDVLRCKECDTRILPGNFYREKIPGEKHNKDL